MHVKELSPRIHEERQLKAVAGVSVEQFLKLLPIFEKLLIEQREANKVNKIKPNNGRKPTLEIPADNLLFFLHYLKCYPTFDQLGFMFNMSGSNACTLLYKLFPVFTQTLDYFNVLPKTEFKSPAEMKEAFKGLDALVIDATERAIQRPQDNTVQEEHYSGKKKNTQIKTPSLPR